MYHNYFDKFPRGIIVYVDRRLKSKRRRRRFWHATQDCVAPYIDIILHRGWL